MINLNLIEQSKWLENTTRKPLSLLMGAGLICLFFVPIFFPNTSSFLPAYFGDSFFLAILITSLGCVLSAYVLIVNRTMHGLTLIDVLFIAFALCALIRFAVHPYSHWSQGRFIWWVVLFSNYGIFRFLLPRLSYQSIFIGLMLIALSQVVIGQLQLFGVLYSYHGAFKITGTFFNPGPYAGFLAILFPLALFEVLRPDIEKEFWSQCLAWLTGLGILLVIIPTQSRAAWLALLGGSALVLFYRFNLYTKLKNLSKARIIGLMIGGISLLLFIGYYFCLLYTSPSPRDATLSRMPSSA